MKKKKSNKVIVVISVILILILLLLGGYFLYDKVLSKSNNKNSNTNETIQKKYKILDDWKNNTTYLTMKAGNNYKVIYDLGLYINFIGFYKNKAYYSNNDSIKYINLSDNNLSEKLWLEIPEPVNSPDPDNSIYKSTIIDDTLYFSCSGGYDNNSGILSLSMNATNFNDYKQVIPDTGFNNWYVNENKDTIYYTKYNGGNGVIPYEYNLKNNTSKKLIDRENIENIMYDNNKILYLVYDSDRFDSNWNKIYSCNCTPHHELYIFDIKNKKTSLITKYFSKNYALYNVAKMINGKIYYYTSDGKIHLYNPYNQNSSDYYTITNNVNYYGFYFINENTMKIYFDPGPSQYVIDGKNVDSLNEINVTMLDGSIRTFSIEDFY